jgi:hypothetical protein
VGVEVSLQFSEEKRKSFKEIKTLKEGKERLETRWLI